VNDSKATNIASARRSLESFAGGVVAIMGGRYKGGDFGDLRDVIRSRAAGIVAIGEAAPLIHAALSDAVPMRTASTMTEAVATAFSMAPRPGTVVLAPACSSFDMFKDYADRGEQFKTAARSLTEGERSKVKGQG
jgi:UDP-N-acetylmuramoylalanine--D-glutamate ligase